MEDTGEDIIQETLGKSAGDSEGNQGIHPGTEVTGKEVH